MGAAAVSDPAAVAFAAPAPSTAAVGTGGGVPVVGGASRGEEVAGGGPWTGTAAAVGAAAATGLGALGVRGSTRVMVATVGVGFIGLAAVGDGAAGCDAIRTAPPTGTGRRSWYRS